MDRGDALAQLESGAVKVKKKPVRLLADPSRVITRFFMPGGDGRAKAIVRRVLELTDDQVRAKLREVEREFSSRHRSIRD
ncbi:unnamed protein product, partial [marine sediment metagenome]